MRGILYTESRRGNTLGGVSTKQGGEGVGKKKEKNNNKNKRLTASHIMLYVALVIYIAVIISGIVLCKHCADVGDIESARYIYTAVASASTLCGSAVFGFYATKASRENVLQISNGKYRMRLDLAKDIYKEFKGATLDEKSMQFMRTLISDENVTMESTSVVANPTGIEVNLPMSSDNFNNDEGLG